MNHKTLIVSLVALALAPSYSFAGDGHKSGPFQGEKANTGFVTHTTEGGKSMLTLSDDFVAPQTPDPHWQVVDSKGNSYLLQKLMIKGEGFSAKAFGPRFCPLIDHSIFQFPDFNRGEDQPFRPLLSARKCNPFPLALRSFLPKNCAAARAPFMCSQSLDLDF
jgi:hypothetical protein